VDTNKNRGYKNSTCAQVEEYTFAE
jgi:hypothetical protein